MYEYEIHDVLRQAHNLFNDKSNLHRYVISKNIEQVLDTLINQNKELENNPNFIIERTPATFTGSASVTHIYNDYIKLEISSRLSPIQEWKLTRL